MLYLTIITLIFYRFTFVRADSGPADAALLDQHGRRGHHHAGRGVAAHRSAALWPFLAMLRPFIAGFTLFFWATATWWIPLLLILGVWRHVVQRYSRCATTRSIGAWCFRWACTRSAP